MREQRPILWVGDVGSLSIRKIFVSRARGERLLLNFTLFLIIYNSLQILYPMKLTSLRVNFFKSNLPWFEVYSFQRCV